MSRDLRGIVVAVTASRRATELAHLIAARGGVPYTAPTVGIEPSTSLESEVARFCDALSSRRVDYAIFMTGPGVFALFAGARSLGREREVTDALAKTRVVARSAKPKDALSKHGIRVDAIPTEATSAGILALLARRVNSSVVAVLSHGSSPSALCDGLKDAGAEVLEFSTYSYALETSSSGAEILDSMRFKPVLSQRARVLELIEATISGKVDAVTFTSPPAAKNLFSIASDAGRLDSLVRAVNDRVIVVAVGPPTRETVEAAGVKVDVIPSVYKMGPMVNDLCSYVRLNGPRKVSRGSSGSAEVL